MKRNLLFYLYPARGSVWRWHIDRLLEYQGAWNGRRIVIAALGTGTDSQEVVESALAPLKAEILWRENDPVLAEARWFLDSLALLESRDPEEATFYAHAKGASKASNDSVLPFVLQWSNAMYTLNLMDVGKIESALRRFPVVGCFRQTWYILKVPWHFSGTFFWLQHDAIFSRNWRVLGDGGGSHGVEAFPGVHFNVGESCCLTDDNIDPYNLYSSPSAASWEKVRQWRHKYLEIF